MNAKARLGWIRLYAESGNAPWSAAAVASPRPPCANASGTIRRRASPGWRIEAGGENLAPDKTAASTPRFLDQFLAALPFPIQRIQTDRGAEFFGYEVQERLMRERIPFRSFRPRSAHLNGKVERSQCTDLEECWPTVDLSHPDTPAGRSPLHPTGDPPMSTPMTYTTSRDRTDFRARHYLFDCAARQLKGLSMTPANPIREDFLATSSRVACLLGCVDGRGDPKSRWGQIKTNQ